MGPGAAAMSESEQWDRYWPCLLDRLRDDEGAGDAKAQSHQSGITLKRYRDAVLRDLIWLLNANARPKPESVRLGGGSVPMGALELQSEDIDASVLNYGIRDLCGTTGSRLKTSDFQRMISDAIKRFEPRILTGKLEVDVHGPGLADSFNTFSFELRGQLWARPVEPLHVETEVDLERGECRLKR